MTTAKQTATAFLTHARDAGFAVSTRDAIVSVHASFAPGDAKAFTRLDGLAPGLLRMLGARGGSVWGTDGGSVGGAVALKNGEFTMNSSGVPKRVAAEIAKKLC